jgi:hypothetical protein
MMSVYVGSHFGVGIRLNEINDLSLATSIENIHLIWEYRLTKPFNLRIRASQGLGEIGKRR